MDPYQYILSYSGYDSGNPQTLTIPPIGWNESGIVYERSDVYHSIFRSYSDTIKFARKSGAETTDIGGGGDDIILFAYDEEGIEAVVNCTVNKRNPQTNDYDLFYYGILDFNPDKFSWDEEFVEISFIDGQKESRFKAREDVNFDINSVVSADGVTIDSFVSQPVNIEFKQINIHSNTITKIDISMTGDTDTDWNPAKDGYFEISSIELNEIDNRLITESETFYENTTESEVVLHITEIGTVTYNLSYIPIVIGNNSGGALVNFRFMLYDETGTFDSVLYNKSADAPIENDIIGTQGYTRDVSFSGIDEYLNIPIGYSVKFNVRITHISLSNMRLLFTLIDSSTFYLTEISLGEPDEDIVCYYPHEAFTRLIQLMTSETDTSKLLYSTKLGRTDSEFQTYPSIGSAASTVLTTGWNLRKFPSKPFNLNIKELFKTFDSIYNLGLGYDRVNDRFYIEDKSEFYNSGLLMFNLGEVNNLVIKPYDQGYYSEILCGYKNKVNPEQFQGANEYCVKAEYLLTVPVKNKLDLQSSINASSIEMELLRRLRYKNYKNEDSNNDEDIYVVVTSSGQVLVNGTYSSGFEGVDEYYNIDITPRENLIRWGNVINVPMWKKDPFDIKFIKSQKGIDINYINQNGNTVNELDDIASNELTGTKLFRPELASFRSKMTTTIMAELNTNPHGVVEFSQNGTDYYGFIKSVKTEDYNRFAEWEIILTDAFVGDNYIFEDGENFIFEDGNNFIFND